MKLLITGASGLYGSKFAELAITKNHEVYAFHRQHPAPYGKPIQVDMTDREKIAEKFQKIQPEVVIHAATMTDVDQCELNRNLAWKTNVQGTSNVAQAAKEAGAFFMYISTDYVFDGEKGCYKETDQASPISYYAYTKLKAEEFVEAMGIQFCIARASVIYGAKSAAGKVNFALWLLNKLKNHEETRVFIDQWNSPTLNSSLAEMTLEVAERRLTGIYHLSGASRMSRYEFAQCMAKTFSLEESLLMPTRMRDLSLPAKRPRDSSLNTSKAKRMLINKPLEIEKALERLKTEIGSLT